MRRNGSPPLLAVSAALSAGWLLVACGDDGTADTETPPTVETTETTELTETTEPTETTAPSDGGENTIEIPSPDVDIPSPELPEVTPSPVPP